MQTAIHMFKNHPKVKEIKFVVLPLCHEIAHSCHDIPQDVNFILDKYAAGQSICEGITFDFSLIKSFGIPQLWFVNTLASFSA